MIYEKEFIVREIPQRYKVLKVVVGHGDMNGSNYLDICNEISSEYADDINRRYRDINAKYLFIVYYKIDDEIKVVKEILEEKPFMENYKGIVRFTKAERSSFGYWFAHWCAFQLTALNLRIWKFKYLFHDCEKPWLRLIWPYKKVQSFHRFHNKHHLEYGLEHGFDKIDWEALMIDWECSEYTKEQCPLDCRGEMENKISQNVWKDYETEIRSHLEPLLNKHKI